MLSATDLVEIWESGISCGTVDRTSLLLQRAKPNLKLEELNALPLGLRNEMLLRLRADVFSPRLKSVMSCDGCGERLEIDLNTEDLLPTGNSRDGSDLEWSSGSLWVHFRVPTGQDLRQLERFSDVDAARRHLVSSCVIQASRDGGSLDASELTDNEINALAKRAAEADPHGDLSLNGECPSCRIPWERSLDAASFFWRELEIEARRLLAEVHALACAYSWSEREILSLSPLRRQAYLEMLAQ